MSWEPTPSQEHWLISGILLLAVLIVIVMIAIAQEVPK